MAAARNAGMPVHLIRGYNQYDPRLISRTAALVRDVWTSTSCTRTK